MRAAVLTGTAVLVIASSGNAQTVKLGPEDVMQSEGLGAHSRWRAALVGIAHQAK
jgi:hypothetical protein